MAESYDFLFKLLLVGGAFVGKTSILTRFSEDAFLSRVMATIGKWSLVIAVLLTISVGRHCVLIKIGDPFRLLHSGVAKVGHKPYQLCPTKKGVEHIVLLLV